ncbi:NACHT domain-containing protein [Pseudoflavitalea sp. G-6-1-2]|uniref:NACHT domain-containing protein n=1 Tax=Pseudoflavitalea sp. G-6-1-2 TaxID=2728841 RepID=UPI00146F22B2|nr:NACHT domain-containing protein [Pseudoflavitalea sp. G-6-1-2]NML22830.1 NACHT domain-containing protein [Pseudoflavitalea sp. G-6-1-2]
MLEKATMSTLLGDRMKDLFSGFVKEFNAEVLHLVKNQLLEYQVEEYNRNAMVKTLLHRVHPMRLKDIYQPLFIQRGRKELYSISDIPKIERRIDTEHAKELFLYSQCITLIGDAGCGKSTIVRHLFLDCIDASFKIPIKIELRYLNDFEGSLIDYIKEKVFRFQKLATNERIIERLMSSGDFVFFLDGFDEIKSSIREKASKEIDDLVKLYSKNCFLLTTRPYTNVEMMPMFINFDVCEMQGDEIITFIRKQFPVAESELAERIIETVKQRDKAAYTSFLSNPLLLSMFILSYQSNAEIPNRKSGFYNQVFDTLYSMHDSLSKLGYVREKESELSKDQIVEVLKLFSFLSYNDEKFLFSVLYANGRLNFIKEKKDSLAFDNSKLLYDLQVNLGILKAEGVDLAFPHRALQEYFSALYIASLLEPNKQRIYEKLQEKYNDWGLLPAHANYYELLYELDQKCFLEYLAIPVFEKLQQMLEPDQALLLLSDGALREEFYSVIMKVAFELHHIITIPAYLTITKLRTLVTQGAQINPEDVSHHKLMRKAFDVELNRSREALNERLQFFRDFIETEKQTESAIVSYMDIPG